MSSVSLATRFSDVRSTTLHLVDPLSAEDCQVQTMTEASPAKWHLAHTTWFFETFVLEAAEKPFTPFHPQFKILFNSYYQAVGEQYPRPRRGLLSRPSLDEVRAYRQDVDERIQRLVNDGGCSEALCGILELGLHHEQQHQELLLMDIQHVLATNPLRCAYGELPEPELRPTAPVRWIGFEGGLHDFGHRGEGFAFDNESPPHRVWLRAFEFADRLVTNGEYLAFMADGGYERPELWLSDGWDLVQRMGWRAPLYWEMHGGVWMRCGLFGRAGLREDLPVAHLSYYEADAYARWKGARLPTEYEWERVVQREIADRGEEAVLDSGNFLEDGWLQPLGAKGEGGRQLFGDLWEWTSSPYVAYPGYKAAEGALGEYNGKFMVNTMVLRGGSCVSPRGHLRASYRNFFAPQSRWLFGGVRLCRGTGD